MARTPVNPELFNRTAPAWNCVDYPADGMHYTPGNVSCAWCGMTPGEIRAEHDARELQEDITRSREEKEQAEWRHGQ